MSKKDWETDGTRNGKPIYCPVNGWDCPYYDQGICHIADPLEDCDDFGAFWDSWEEYDSCDDDEDEESYDYPDDMDETGFNPYMGGYDYDC